MAKNLSDDLLLKGKALRFKGVSAAPTVSAADHAGLYYDSDDDDIFISRNGGTWGRIAEGLKAERLTFTETTGAGTYTGSVSLPAGAILMDIIVHAAALWTATTSAVLKVGDVADDDGFFVGVDLKATDLLAGESISLMAAGGKQGADLDDVAAPGSHVRRRYLATARTISGVVTTVGAAGAAGITHIDVIYLMPRVTAATKA